MTRTELLAEYDVVDGRVCTPGPLLGQRAYVAYFFSRALEGWADWEDEDDVFGFVVMPEDRAEFPELALGQKVLIQVGAAGIVREVIPTL